MDIVQKLMDKLNNAEGIYRNELVEKIITICSQGNYQYIADFEWYITVLMELTHVPMMKHGNLIASQFMDVAIRVKVVRPFAVKNMISLLKDPRLLTDTGSNNISEILYSAAWIVGEFSQYTDNHEEVIESLLQPRAVSLPPHIQSVYMQNVLKIFAFIVSGNPIDPDEEVPGRSYSQEEIDNIIQLIKNRIPLFTQSVHLEVQERVSLYYF